MSDHLLAVIAAGFALASFILVIAAAATERPAKDLLSNVCLGGSYATNVVFWVLLVTFCAQP